MTLSFTCVLQEGSYIYNTLYDALKKNKGEEEKELVMARVSNMPCPVNLDKKPSKVHVHPSNGVFVGVRGNVIYCSCSECKFEEDRGGSLNLVEGTERLRYSWAVITEEEYYTLVTGEQSRPLPCVYVYVD